MKRTAAYITVLLLVVWSLPFSTLAQSRNAVLIKNGTVMTAIRGTLENTDILIENGKIAKIGKNIAAPAGAKVIDATGKYVTPGIVDCHSHTMLEIGRAHV